VAAPDDATPELATVRLLAEAYPGDPGIVISLMLHRVTLARGEVLYLPAGNIHAYLRGVGIELMASSDNVLRGSLSPKHIAVPELLSVLLEIVGAGSAYNLSRGDAVYITPDEGALVRGAWDGVPCHDGFRSTLIPAREGLTRVRSRYRRPRLGPRARPVSLSGGGMRRTYGRNS
jgi:hypothetical protein